MTQGLGFLLAMLFEAAVAALLGWLIARRRDLPPSATSFRCCAASVIGTGITHPILWLWLSRWMGITGSRWGGTLSALCLVILLEGLVFAAALRGRWRLAWGLSAAANAAAFGAVLLINWLLPRSA